MLSRAEALLAERISDVTGAGDRLVRQAVADFARKGFIKAAVTNGHLRWYWTHNRHEEFGPASVTRLRVAAPNRLERPRGLEADTPERLPQPRTVPKG